MSYSQIPSSRVTDKLAYNIAKDNAMLHAKRTELAQNPDQEAVQALQAAKASLSAAMDMPREVLTKAVKHYMVCDQALDAIHQEMKYMQEYIESVERYMASEDYLSVAKRDALKDTNNALWDQVPTDVREKCGHKVSVFNDKPFSVEVGTVMACSFRALVGYRSDHDHKFLSVYILSFADDKYTVVHIKHYGEERELHFERISADYLCPIASEN